MRKTTRKLLKCDQVKKNLKKMFVSNDTLSQIHVESFSVAVN